MQNTLLKLMLSGNSGAQAVLSTFNPTDMNNYTATNKDGQSTVKLNVASADATSMFTLVRNC